MAERDELFKKFGPLFLEAIALMVLDEINELRAQHGLAPRTAAQVIAKLKNTLATLQPYDWMQLIP